MQTIIPTSNGIVSAWRTLVELSLDILVFGDIFMGMHVCGYCYHMHYYTIAIDSFTAHLARKRVAPKQVGGQVPSYCPNISLYCLFY